MNLWLLACALPHGQPLLPSSFPDYGLSQTYRGLGAASLPPGCRAPAPEPSNGEQAGQHTTYPELLELGPGQGGARRSLRRKPSP